MKKLFPYMITISLVIIAAACNGDKTTTQTKDDSANPPPAKVKTGTIVFFGNSITAGYGVDPSEAFPALIQKKIDSVNLPYKVVNAGVSGETTAGGKSRIDWILKQPLDVFVLELGGNDGLRGIPVSETKKNLQTIIDKVKAKYPNAPVILAGMQIPPNMGQAYTRSFRDIYSDLAAANNIPLIPFILEGVGGTRELNLPDGIHPTAEGHKMVAETVWKVLGPVIPNASNKLKLN